MLDATVNKLTSLMASKLIPTAKAGRLSACLTITVVEPSLSGTARVPRSVALAKPPVSGINEAHT